MRRRADPTPWGTWALGWLIAIVFTGGVVYVITDTESPLRVFDDPVAVETTIRDVHVLAEGQTKIEGTLTSLDGGDVVAPPLRLPLQFPAAVSGAPAGATIEDALIDGQRSTIVWDGGRPFVLEGDGGLDLGPVPMGVQPDGSMTWLLSDGVRALLEGRYVLRTPVAVGQGGLAQPRDQVDFLADDETTIETHGVAAHTGATALRLEGPGTLVVEGSFTIRTREGTRNVTHVEFGPGPFALDIDPRVDGMAVSGTLQGELHNVR